MVGLTISCLILLAMVSYRLAGRAICHPAVVFCSAWAAGLSLIWVCGDLFYPLSPKTPFVFLSGAVAFSAGSALSPTLFQLNSHKREPPRYTASNWILNALVLSVALCAPVAITWMLKAIAQQQAANFFVRASMTMLDESLRNDPGYIFFSNVVTFSGIVAVLAFVERERHQVRWLLSGSVALALMILTAGRAFLVLTILSLFCIDWIKVRRIRWKAAIAFGLLCALLVIGIAVFLGKAGASTEASVADNSAPVIQGLALYAAGSLVAYDRVVRQPDITPHNWRITRFLEQRLHRISNEFKAPNEFVEFVNVGPNGFNLNTYTMFFAFFDMGWTGMSVMFLILGGITAMAYRHAMNGGPIALVTYGAFFSAIILGLFGDYYFNNLNYLLKLWAISWCVYVLPYAWRHIKPLFRLRIDRLLAPVK